MLRISVASALSLSTAIPKAPPTPTPVPTASALASRMRVMLPSASTATSPATFNAVLAVPRYALTYKPETLSPSTGTTDVPPDAPAPAFTCSLPVKSAFTETSESSVIPARLNTTPSSIAAMQSMPVMPTAIPAPTPTLLGFVLIVLGIRGIETRGKSNEVLIRLPDASPTVVKSPLPVEMTDTPPPVSLYMGPFFKIASLHIEETCTPTAPAIPSFTLAGIWPDLATVDDTTLKAAAFTRMPPALSSAWFAISMAARFLWKNTVMPMPPPTALSGSVTGVTSPEPGIVTTAGVLYREPSERR